MKKNNLLLFTLRNSLRKTMHQEVCHLLEKLGFSQEKIICSRKSNPYLTMRFKLKFGEIVHR